MFDWRKTSLKACRVGAQVPREAVRGGAVAELLQEAGHDGVALRGDPEMPERDFEWGMNHEWNFYLLRILDDEPSQGLLW